MHETLTDSRLANVGARTIHAAFDRYQDRFRVITQRAAPRFVSQDWAGFQADSAERLDLYRVVAQDAAEEIRTLLDGRTEDKIIWASMKAVYSGLIAGRDDWELAETFFNSVTRRIFATAGVDPQIEFVASDYDTPPTSASGPVYRMYPRAASTQELVQGILSDAHFGIEIGDVEGDAERVAKRIEEHLRTIGALRVVERAEIVSSVFYRTKRAYLVGRLYSGSHVIPVAFALASNTRGVVVDAVLLTESQLSILFSFTRSYFHVAVDRPYDLVRFLRTLMPRKRVAELYNSIGANRHGKTELYRDLLRSFDTSGERFHPARGAAGLVMVVFTIPAFDVVFKVFRDVFSYPKRTTRRAVIERYELVSRHDRGGRLVDAQSFEHLKFDRSRFTAEVFEELVSNCSREVVVQGDDVIVHYAYVERRVIPLDIYVKEADPAAARDAIVDYGRAIKDLATSNVFPGDMLLKNFGVTRHGRVVFYDYDELTLVTECNFRPMPVAGTPEDEMAAEPWFSVGENDVFPEEFRTFLGLEQPLRAVFEQHHSDLFDPAYWKGIQQRLLDGEVLEITPYDESAVL